MFISVLTEHRIKQVSFSIYRPVEISPATTDLDVRLVQIPGMSRDSTTFDTQVLTDQRGKSKLPGPDSFITDLESSL